MGLIKNYQRSVIDRVKENKATFIIFTILRVLIVVIMVRSIFIGNYEGVFTCVLTLLLLLIPSFLKGALRISIPPLFESIIYLFIFSANILGELARFYAHIPIWDTMLHTLNGFLFAAVGYSTVDLLNRSSKKIKLSPLYLTLVAFCVSMTIGVLWEFFECGMDLFFGTDMQKDFLVDTIRSTKLDPTNNQNVIVVKDIVNTTITTRSGEVTTIDGGYLDIGILDTMKDLFVNFIGAIVFCIFGFIYEKVGRKNKTAAMVVEGLKIRPASEEEIKQMEGNKQAAINESKQKKNNKKKKKK
ncbi:hypothetical protein [Ruminococcus sp.]|uniref:hypothetical protein n=1 Tax=Ruminococcus sp. TaxID=41978 RepID=UPI002E802AE8|nr:hypothetical protein [Ruminococcus sp.]MEE3493102.1 hypothetical protein [Ruminococcus sp.]